MMTTQNLKKEHPRSREKIASIQFQPITTNPIGLKSASRALLENGKKSLRYLAGVHSTYAKIGRNTRDFHYISRPR